MTHRACRSSCDKSASVAYLDLLDYMFRDTSIQKPELEGRTAHLQTSDMKHPHPLNVSDKALHCPPVQAVNGK